MTGVLDQLDIELEEREAALADLVPFVCRFTPGYSPGWVHWEIGQKLREFMEAIERRESPRLIITMPPRHGKSTLSTIGLPPWVWAHHPEWDIITGCYSSELAGDFGEQVGGIVNSPEYKALAPGTVLGRRHKEKRGEPARDRFNTTRGGRYRAIGVGGGATGRGAHLFIVDDPYKGPEEADSEAFQKKVLKWYYGVASTRLAPGGGILIVMTRWGENDLVGHLLEAMDEVGENSGERWQVIDYPALAKHDEPNRREGDALHPERYSRDALEAKRAAFIRGGQARLWNALFQCSPTPDQGIFFKKEWFRTYETLPNNLTWYAGTDWAIGEKRLNDHSVVWAFGVDADGNVYFAPSCYRKRGSTGPESIHALKETMRRHGAMMCAYDETVIGKSLEGFLRERMGPYDWKDPDTGKVTRSEPYYFSLWTFTPSKDKATHASALRVAIENGRVFFPEGTFFREVVLPEFLAFLGGGKHDDLVDACAWSIIMIHELAKGARPAAKRTPPPDVVKRLKELNSRRPGADGFDMDAYRPLFG